MAQPEVVAHWHLLVDDFTTDVGKFYSEVEEQVRERGIPDLTTERFSWREGGLFSAKREYLRVRRDKQMFDLCAAPYGGHSFFFSSWGLVEQDGFLSRLPVVGPMLKRLFKPATYYSHDTTMMFQESVSRALAAAIESVRHQQGLRALSAEQLRPVFSKATVASWT